MFKYLEKTKGKKMPFIVKAIYVPDAVTDQELIGLSTYQIQVILSKQPKLIDRIDLSKLKDYEYTHIVGEVLLHQPQLIDRFDTSGLEDYGIANVLVIYPQLINKFDLSKLDGDSIEHILRFKPELVDKLDLSKMHGGNVADTLYYQPQLVDKLDLSKMKGRDGNGFRDGLKLYRCSLKIRYLINTHPGLRNNFQKAGLL